MSAINYPFIDFGIGSLPFERLHHSFMRTLGRGARGYLIVKPMPANGLAARLRDVIKHVISKGLEA